VNKSYSNFGDNSHPESGSGVWTRSPNPDTDSASRPLFSLADAWV